MKEQKEFKRRLKLHKEVIAQLDDRGMSKAVGGSGDTCNTYVCCCDTSIPSTVTLQNPCPVLFTEPPC